MLSLKQIENVCNIDDSSGKKCRYLSKHNNTENYICLKLSEQNKKIIDEQVKAYMCFNGNIKNFSQPPIGDNCSGYVISLYVEQGYDIKD